MMMMMMMMMMKTRTEKSRLTYEDDEVEGEDEIFDDCHRRALHLVVSELFVPTSRYLADDFALNVVTGSGFSLRQAPACYVRPV